MTEPVEPARFPRVVLLVAALLAWFFGYRHVVPWVQRTVGWEKGHRRAHAVRPLVRVAAARRRHDGVRATDALAPLHRR